MACSSRGRAAIARSGWRSLIAAGVAVLAVAAPAEERPRVLILGDSISIGYTPHVQELLKGEAEVVRLVWDG